VHRLDQESLITASKDVTAVPSSEGQALVFGASGGIGNALAERLRADSRFSTVIELSRASDPAFDLTDENSIAEAAANIARSGNDIRLAIVATGALDRQGCSAEKSWRQIDPVAMAKSFAINTIGPALLMKHFLPLLPRSGRSVFAALSARVGSIGDNRLGGWYSYRAAKAALNQVVHTASIELQRSRPQAICVALHPGTVDTGLTAGFAKSGLEVQTPEAAAGRIIAVIDALQPSDSGRFFDQRGTTISW
jgi:NAD(P)-dependent dehydrogenase (short-subunit alcohol dehydrogenase family)